MRGLKLDTFKFSCCGNYLPLKPLDLWARLLVTRKKGGKAWRQYIHTWGDAKMPDAYIWRNSSDVRLDLARTSEYECSVQLNGNSFRPGKARLLEMMRRMSPISLEDKSSRGLIQFSIKLYASILSICCCCCCCCMKWDDKRTKLNLVPMLGASEIKRGRRWRESRDERRRGERVDNCIKMSIKSLNISKRDQKWLINVAADWASKLPSQLFLQETEKPRKFNFNFLLSPKWMTTMQCRAVLGFSSFSV